MRIFGGVVNDIKPRFRNRERTRQEREMADIETLRFNLLKAHLSTLASML